MDCDCATKNVARALDGLLAGTELGYVELGSQVIIVPRARLEVLPRDATLNGRVRSELAVPVAGATARLRLTADSTVRSVTGTDALGFFAFRDLMSGRYRLTIGAHRLPSPRAGDRGRAGGGARARDCAGGAGGGAGGRGRRSPAKPAAGALRTIRGTDGAGAERGRAPEHPGRGGAGSGAGHGCSPGRDPCVRLHRCAQRARRIGRSEPHPDGPHAPVSSLPSPRTLLGVQPGHGAAGRTPFGRLPGGVWRSGIVRAAGRVRRGRRRPGRRCRPRSDLLAPGGSRQSAGRDQGRPGARRRALEGLGAPQLLGHRVQADRAQLPVQPHGRPGRLRGLDEGGRPGTRQRVFGARPDPASGPGISLYEHRIDRGRL